MPSIAVLFVEDSPADAAIMVRELERSGWTVVHQRVDGESDLRAALDARVWDLVISDYALPGFGGRQALELVKSAGHEIPFLVVSGTLGEETAVAMLKAGGDDFLLKGNLARLPVAVDRAMREAAERRARKRAEAEVRASEERLRIVMDSLGDVVFTTDRRLRHTHVFGSRLTEPPRSPDSLLGRSPHELWNPLTAEAHRKAMERALAGERSMLEWSVGSSARVRYFQTVFSPLRSDAGDVEGVVGVERDVTQQRELTAQLAASDRLASVGMLAAGVAHELNNPLAALVANLELATREAQETAPENLRLSAELDDATEAATRLRHIVRDISLFSRPQSDETRAVDVASVIDSSIRVATSETRHVAQVIVEHAALPPVRANQARLGQLFLNLVVNAAQAIPEGNASQNVIRVRSFLGGPASGTPEGTVVVEVSDSGVGMSEETLRRIFDPFFTTKPVGRGTGLGLSICQRIVTALGGELTARSEPGGGSTFRVVLPAAPDLGSSAPEKGAEPRRPSLAPARRHRLLLVDDERLVLSMLQRLLAMEHEVVALSRATDAADRIAAGERFDLILCDVMMPDITGMELHQRLTVVAPDQAERMVFVTGGAFSVEAQDFLARVPNPRLEKPFDVDVLRELVRDRIALLGTVEPSAERR